ncbi:MAG TPA: HAMP domain-containing sensor histidine kinase [Gaiellaceae bacterium]|nr:HAMP domain-containing sensor histidine kinase [Gaiellaceae bacterium]
MNSLRAREFAAISVAVVASVGVTLVLAVLLVRSSARHAALDSLARQAALIAEQQRASSEGGRLTSLGAFFDTQQEQLAILGLPQAALLLPTDGGTALRAGKPAQGSVVVSGHRYLYAARPVRRQAVVLLRSTTLEASDLHPFTIAFLIAAAVGALIAAVAAFLVARAIARPIERVSQASLALAAGERPGPLPVEGSTEVAALAASFNRLATDLDRARDAERSFLLSVSHELKTPLAAIRGHGEAILDGVMSVPKAAGVVVQESKRLERLVRDLLDLARLNQRSFSIHAREIDLTAVVAQAVTRHGPEATRVDVALLGQTNGRSPALADPDRTLQVLSNLVENAIRTTPAGGSVTVSAYPGAITVSDTGPGIDADELPHAFERFFLYTRYASHRAVGTGLGLAIVKELTEAMGGGVTVESEPGTGTRFTVRLPEPLGLPRSSDPL